MTEPNVDGSATHEKPEDFGKGKEGVVKRWNTEWLRASKREKFWRAAGRETVRTYRAETERAQQGTSLNARVSRFNILWSNTEVMRPSLYNQTPRPDVRRRFRDEDEGARDAAEILERAVAFTLDDYDFDQVMINCVDDFMLPGRGVARVVYRPVFENQTIPAREPGEGDFDALGQINVELDEQGLIPPQTFEKKVFEEVITEHWDWELFRIGPGRKWVEVPWIGFEHRMTQDQIDETFRGTGADTSGIELDFDDGGEGRDSGEGEGSNIGESGNRLRDPATFKRAVIREFWDKDKRERLWVAPSKVDGPVLVQKDPMGLKDFFPVPRPIYAIKTTDSTVPVEEYRQYRPLAEELDRMTQRIRALIAALKVRGAYDATLKELGQVLQGDDNALVPLTEGLASIQASGGLDKAIWLLPIEKIIVVVRQLYEQREQLKQSIFEITGLSDILRGSTDPDETLGAQQIKAQTGSLRLQQKQREIQRFARDLIRLKAEIIAEHFDSQTISMMTSREVTPQIMQLFRSDPERRFRIDIETDSTIAADQATEQRNVAELLGGINQFMAGVAPAVESGIIPMEAAKAIVLAAVRRFRFGRQVEEALDEAGDEQQQQQPDPAEDMAAQAQQAEMQAVQAEAEAKGQSIQIKAQLDQTKGEADATKLQRDAQLAEAQHQVAMQKLQREAQEDEREHEVKMRSLALRAAQAEQASQTTQ